MTPESYILSFDFSEITRQISSLQDRYAELSSEFKSLANSAVDSVGNLQKSIDSLNSSLDQSLGKVNAFYSKLQGGMAGLSGHFNQISESSDKIAKNIKNISKIDLQNLSEGPGTAQDRMSRLSGGSDDAFFKLHMDINAKTEKMAASALQKGEAAIKAARKALEESKSSVDKIKAYASKEITNLKKSMSGGVQGMLPPGMGGGLLGGLLGLLIWGVHETQRKSAERGEMQAVVAQAGGVFEKGTQKAIDHLAAFGEHAQRQYAITRQEVQGVVSQIAAMGIKIDDKLINTKENVKGLTTDVVTASLRIDTLLNISSGSTMQRTLDVVRNYGVSVKNAYQQVKKLSFEAQNSGMDIQKFIGTVMSSSSATAQYGFELKDVSKILSTIQGNYKAMGIDPQKAGNLAAGATTNIMRGLSNLPEGVEMMLAQQIYGGEALGAVQRMRTTFLKGSKSEKLEVKNALIKDFYEYVEKQASGNEPVKIQMIADMMGLSTTDAKAFADMAQVVSLGGPQKRLTKPQQDSYDKAFEIKSATLTDLQKAQKDLFEGLAEIGTGLLQVLVGLVSAVTLGFKSIVAAVAAVDLRMNLKGDKADMLWAEIDQMYGRVADIIQKGVKNIKGGAFKAMGAGGDTLNSIFGDKVLKDMKFDPFKYNNEGLLKTLENNVDQKLQEMTRSVDSKIDNVMFAIGQITEEELYRRKKGRDIDKQTGTKRVKTEASKVKVADYLGGLVQVYEDVDPHDEMSLVDVRAAVKAKQTRQQEAKVSETTVKVTE